MTKSKSDDETRKTQENRAVLKELHPLYKAFHKNVVTEVGKLLASGKTLGTIATENDLQWSDLKRCMNGGSCTSGAIIDKLGSLCNKKQDAQRIKELSERLTGDKWRGLLMHPEAAIECIFDVHLAWIEAEKPPIERFVSVFHELSELAQGILFLSKISLKRLDEESVRDAITAILLRDSFPDEVRHASTRVSELIAAKMSETIPLIERLRSQFESYDAIADKLGIARTTLLSLRQGDAALETYVVILPKLHTLIERMPGKKEVSAKQPAPVQPAVDMQKQPKILDSSDLKIHRTMIAQVKNAGNVFKILRERSAVSLPIGEANELCSALNEILSNTGLTVEHLIRVRQGDPIEEGDPLMQALVEELNGTSRKPTPPHTRPVRKALQ